MKSKILKVIVVLTIACLTSGYDYDYCVPAWLYSGIKMKVAMLQGQMFHDGGGHAVCSNSEYNMKYEEFLLCDG